MPTYLQLCRNVAMDAGLGSGSAPPSVENQTGIMAKLVKFVADADVFIQNMWQDWQFMWDSASVLLPEGVDTLAKPDGLRTWDTESLIINKGKSDAQPVACIPYKEIRNVDISDTAANGKPAFASVMPTGGLTFYPAPETGLTLDYEFYRSPARMVSDGDVSPIPENMHRVIEALAISYYAKLVHDSGLLDLSMAEFKSTLDVLEAEQLPDRMDRVSQPTEMVVIPQ